MMGQWSVVELLAVVAEVRQTGRLEAGRRRRGGLVAQEGMVLMLLLLQLKVVILLILLLLLLLEVQLTVQRMSGRKRRWRRVVVLQSAQQC